MDMSNKQEIFTFEEIFKELTDFQTSSKLEEFPNKNILKGILENISNKRDLENNKMYISININNSLKELKNIEDNIIDIFKNNEVNETDKENISTLLKTSSDIKTNINKDDYKSVLILETSLDEIINKLNEDEFNNKELKELYVSTYNNLSITLISYKLLKLIDGFDKIKNR